MILYVSVLVVDIKVLDATLVTSTWPKILKKMIYLTKNRFKNYFDFFRISFMLDFMFLFYFVVPS